MESNRQYPGFAHALLLCAFFLGFQFVFVTPFAIAQEILKVTLVHHPAVLSTINLATVALVIWLGMLIGRVRLREILVLRAVPWRFYPAFTLTIVGLLILLSEADNLVKSVLPTPTWVLQFFQNMLSNAQHPIGAFVMLVIVAPLTEESLVRGLFLRGFLTRYRVVTAILLSAFLFAALHANPWQFISAGVLGVALAWWYVRLRSLVPCLFGHALNNGLVFASPFFPFQIPGFTQPDIFAAPEFQPWWFNCIGLALTCLGVGLFWWMARGYATPGIGTQLPAEGIPQPEAVPPVYRIDPTVPPPIPNA